MAADPIVTVGPIGSPQGGTAASGTANSNGQADACLDQQHSSANPSATSTGEVLQIADSSCPTTAAGTPTTSGSATGAASGGSGGSSGGGGTQSSSTSATNSNGSSTKSSTSTSATAGSTKIRRAAGFTAPLRTVAAAGASGLRIAHVRYQLLRVKQAKRLRVLVILQDRKRRLVRSAIVTIGRLAGAKTTLSGTIVAFSNRKGQAAFVVRVTRSMPGKRVLLRIGARTPHARTLVVGAVVVPKQLPKHGALHHLTYT